MLLMPHIVYAKTVNDECAIFFPGQATGRQQQYALIRCPFAGDPNDTIYVYDRQGDLQISGDWKIATDFDDDLWIFDAGGDGAAELIIDYYQDSSGLKADLYDDQNGDGKVNYEEAEDGIPVIVEGSFPTVSLLATDGWWENDGLINYNLQIIVDGKPRATFYTIEQYVSNLQTNGVADYLIFVEDTDRDGRPDFETRRVVSPNMPNWLIRQELVVNTSNNEIAPDQGFLFWPYLGNISDYIKPYGSGAPPIQMDWKNQRIQAIGEFVATRGNEANWFVYSTKEFGAPGQLLADFENPFAFYDLAADEDGQPELMIRSQYNDPYDPLFLDGTYPQAIEIIRYSWNQDNDPQNSLEYKLDLIGRHLYTDLVSVGELNFRSVPYMSFPDWVTRNSWDAAHFIATENFPYISSEGIYDGFVREWRDDFVTGRLAVPPMQRVQDIRAGLRHEYNPQFLFQPWLYFSPLDHKLHLRGASGGVWNIDDNLRMRYRDLDGDGYLDQWTLVRGRAYDPQRPLDAPLEETEIKSLQVVGGYLILSGDQKVTIVQANPPRSLFETLPPTNNESWNYLNELLAENSSDVPAQELNQVAGLYTGLTTILDGVSLEDIKAFPDGFQFVLHLYPGFQIGTNENNVPLESLIAGDYLIKYNGAWQSEPLVPYLPKINIQVQDNFGQSHEKPISILVSSTSDGLSDYPGLILILEAVQNGKVIELLRQPIDLQAGQPVVATAAWHPLSDGYWSLKARLIDKDQQSYASNEIEYHVSKVLPSVGQLTLPTLTRLVAILSLAGIAIFLVVALRQILGFTAKNNC
jgi:hypothetical protein